MIVTRREVTAIVIVTDIQIFHIIITVIGCLKLRIIIVIGFLKF